MSGILAELQSGATALYDKAWGRQWPREERLLDIGDISDSNELDGFVTTRVSSRKYVCLVDMDDVKNALGVEEELGDTLLVRHEYESLINVITTGNYEKEDIVLTGQAGIGKTIFLYYLLLYRLERKLPTAIQLSSQHYFLFDEEGPMVFSLAMIDDYSRLKRCCALTDSNADVIQPCSLFLSAAPRIIQTTAPNRECFEKWVKQREGEGVIMDLPTMEEIAAIVKERGDSPSLCLPFVRKWGPCTRTILALMAKVKSGAVADFEDTLSEQAAQAAIDICAEPILLRCMGLWSPLKGISSNLVFVRPTRTLHPDGDFEWEQWYPLIPTEYLVDIFETQRVRITNDRALQLFEVLNCHSRTRSSDGWSLEVRMHRQLCTTDTAMHIFREGDDRRVLPSQTLLPSTLSGLKAAGVSDAFYWIPITTDFSGIDAVLGGADGEIYAVQATTATDHASPLRGLEKLWDTLSADARPQRQLNIVLVADTARLATVLMDKYSRELRCTTFGRKKRPVIVWGCHLDTAW